MSSIPENTDLNTGVILSEVSVVGDYKEGLESEVKEENVGGAKEVKMEDNSLKESVKEEKGLVFESRVGVVNAGLGSSSSDSVEGAILKVVSLESEMGEKGFAAKERNPAENSGNWVSGANVEVDPELGSDKVEESVAKERVKEVSVGAKMDKMEINYVEDSGAKLGDMSFSQPHEGEKGKEDFSKKEKGDSLGAEMDKKDFSYAERKAVEDSGAKLDERSHSLSLEAKQGKKDFVEKETEKGKIDPADVEQNAVEDSGTRLNEPSCLQSLEAEKEKSEFGGKEKETSLEVEKNKKDFTELGRKAVEDSDAKLEALPCVSEFVELKSSEVTESTSDVLFVEGETKVNPDESASKSNADEILGTKLGALPCASEDTEPEPVEATEYARESTDGFMVVDGEMKVDLSESLPQKGSEVGDVSGGLRNGGSESGSDSIGIVIDLNPKKGKGKGKGAPKKSKAKSVPLEHGFSFGDLIWGKVRSHPWWPAQICDSSAASKKAKKYFKRDTYLVAYYGDNTFAWNEVSRMKPFFEHFSQLEKQSNTEDFRYAIDCALEEVSRRVEFGLACSCLSEQVYSQIETQTIVNTGILEELSTKAGGDASLTVASFQPVKLVRYIRELAQSLNGGADDKLEFAVARSELLAFSRWKGYTELPEFFALGLILESDADMSLTSTEKECDDSIPEKGTSHARNSSSVKRKLECNASPAKKKRKVSDLTVEEGVKTPKTSENGLKSKASGKKRKSIVDSPVKEAKSLVAEVDNKPLLVQQSFRIGERISKVASQLNASSPILKNGVGKCKSSQPPQTSMEGSKPGKPVEADEVSPQISADPSTENSLSSDDDEDKKSLEDLFRGKKRSGKKLAKRGNKPKRKGVPNLPHELGQTTESYWSERIGKSIPEDQDDTGEAQLERRKSPELESDTDEKIAGENLESKSDDGLFVTALILNFSGPDSVPSRASLNKIFGSYKSLDESKTEILKNNRAKVVFKKRSDAETAFSSAGKYSTFGRSLVSYRLKYMSSSPPSNKDNKATREAKAN